METKKRIRILQDPDPINPFVEIDGNPPIMYEGARGIKSEYPDSEIKEFITSKATDKLVIKHQEEIAEILEINLDDYIDVTIDDKISDIVSEIYKANLKQLAKLCKVFKILHINWISKGYSQSDWLDVLVVLTDNFFETTGCSRKKYKSILKETQDLLDAWAWGDVYGFILEECKVYKKVLASEFDAGNFEDVGEEEEWEEIDSCWGFYGDKWMENGMSDHIPKELHDQLKNFDNNDIEY